MDRFKRFLRRFVQYFTAAILCCTIAAAAAVFVHSIATKFGEPAAILTSGFIAATIMSAIYAWSDSRHLR